jgi:choline dehydrogenase-like flavoprotein
MPFVTSATLSGKQYDAVVVGSGAAGGQTAYTLAMAGRRF